MDTYIKENVALQIECDKYSPEIKVDDGYIMAYYKYPEICGELGKLSITESNLKMLRDKYEADCVLLSVGYNVGDEYIVDEDFFDIKFLLDNNIFEEKE